MREDRSTNSRTALIYSISVLGYGYMNMERQEETIVSGGAQRCAKVEMQKEKSGEDNGGGANCSDRIGSHACARRTAPRDARCEPGKKESLASSITTCEG